MYSTYWHHRKVQVFYDDWAVVQVLTLLSSLQGTLSIGCTDANNPHSSSTVRIVSHSEMRLAISRLKGVVAELIECGMAPGTCWTYTSAQLQY